MKILAIRYLNGCLIFAMVFGAVLPSEGIEDHPMKCDLTALKMSKTKYCIFSNTKLTTFDITKKLNTFEMIALMKNIRSSHSAIGYGMRITYGKFPNEGKKVAINISNETLIGILYSMNNEMIFKSELLLGLNLYTGDSFLFCIEFQIVEFEMVNTWEVDYFTKSYIIFQFII